MEPAYPQEKPLADPAVKGIEEKKSLIHVLAAVVLEQRETGQTCMGELEDGPKSDFNTIIAVHPLPAHTSQKHLFLTVRHSPTIPTLPSCPCITHRWS